MPRWLIPIGRIFYALGLIGIGIQHFLVLVVLDHVPGQLAATPGQLAAWTNAFKALTIAGGAWVVAGSLEGRKSKAARPLEVLMPVGRFFLPITVIVFGIDHFLYPAFVATLVPAWIPGASSGHILPVSL